jgi:hypothetical protein
MKLGFRALFLVFSFFISFDSHGAVINWLGGISTNGALGANWSGGLVPTSADDVHIGVITTTFTRNPVISTVQACKSLTLGSNNVITLTITAAGSLAVTGAFNNMPSATTNVTSTITGEGLLTCASLQVGDGTSPTIGNNNTVTLISTLANLRVTGGLTVNSTNYAIIFMGTGYINATFSLRGGTTTVDGQLYTLNSQQGILPNTNAIPKLSVDMPTGSALNPILKLTNIIPINASSVTRSIDFFNNTGGTGTATIEYAGAAGQTIYTNTTNTILDTTATVYQNITFSGTGQKNIQTGNLTVSGNWASADGKVDAVTNSPAVIFKGAVAQSLTDNGSDATTGVVFKNLQFQGGNTKTMSTGKFTINSTGILYMGSGSTTLNANGNLTLQSRTASTSSVAPIPTLSSITGNVAVQRLLIGGNTKSGTVYTARGYRMLTSPVNINGTGLYSLSYIGLTALTGGSGTGFTVTNNSPTIYLFREDVTPSNTTFNSGKHKGVSSINNDNTINVSGTAGSFQIPAGNGYIFYFVGNISNPLTKASGTPTTGPENTIITATGNLNQGDVVTKLWYTPAGATITPINTKLSYSAALSTSGGYNMVGNPYAATLDLSKVITDNSGITNSIYVLDNVNPGQQYIAYSPGGSSSPKATQYVTSGQGFIVKATGINATLTFRESEKAIGFQPATLLMGLPVAETRTTGFYLKIEKDSIINDYCGVYFNGSNSANFTAEDAKDLDGTTSQIYMSSYSADGVRTAINRMPDYFNGIKTRLYVNAAADGIYKLKIEDIRNIDTFYDIWLKDKYKRDSLDIRRYGTYNFNIIRSDTASFGGNRFEIVVRRKPLPPYQLINFTAAKVTEGIQLNWKTYNEGNFTGFGVEKLQPGTDQYTPLYNVQSSGKTNYSFLDSQPVIGVNTYRLQQNDINNAITWSKPITISKVDPVVTTNGDLINVYPNPAATIINVSLNPTVPANGYVSKIYDYSGSLVSNQTVQGSNWTQDVGRLQPGTYILQLNKNTGELVGRSKFIKK